MAPDHFHAFRPLVMLRRHVLHRHVQLLWVERDEPGQRDDEEYGRYVPHPRDLDCESGSRVGRAGVAILLVAGGRVRDVGVS